MSQSRNPDALSRLEYYYELSRALGWENLPRRVLQILRHRLGLQKRRLPGGQLSRAELASKFIDGYDPADARARWHARRNAFFWNTDDQPAIRKSLKQIVPDAAWNAGPGELVLRLSRGEFPLFNHAFGNLGSPPDFQLDPIHAVNWPVGRHWTDYEQFDPKMADLKCVWEASRFTWAFTLSRAYMRDGDDHPARLFWNLLDDWDRQNPYGLTAQWVCGQEASFRLFAWLFAALATLDSPAASDSRLHRLTELIWYTGRHIQKNINYARGQKNNHAISEAVGLWTIGALFPELRDAARWRKIGWRVFGIELRRQIAEDGSYVQNSLNYHRLLLDDVLWGLRLGLIHRQSLPPESLRKIDAAIDWLIEMVDPATGGAPNYGPNDGASVLPWSTCDYTDYRPVVQAAHYLTRATRCYDPGPWDEKLLWLFGVDALNAPIRNSPRRPHRAMPDGGYFLMSGPRTWSMTRCHTYRGRPGQADMLHLDLWIDGINLLRDAGSFHYYSRPPWHDYFNSTAAHNTLEVDRADQMIKGPRFLWLRWTRSRLRRFTESPDGRLAFFDGEHFGYTRLSNKAVHQRCILRIEDSFFIIDHLLGTGHHELGLRWRLPDLAWIRHGNEFTTTLAHRPVRIAIIADPRFQVDLLRGQESPDAEGWESLYYADKQPVPTIRVNGTTALPVRIGTRIDSPDDDHVSDLILGDEQEGAIARLVTRDPRLAQVITETSGGRIRGIPPDHARGP